MANPALDQAINGVFIKFLPFIILAGFLSAIPKKKRSRATRSRKLAAGSGWGDNLVLLPRWVSGVLAIVSASFLASMATPWSSFSGIAFVLFGGLAAISALRSLVNKRLLENQTSLASLRELPWKRFEDIIAEVYRRQGYKVEETLGGGPDGGIDLKLGRDGAVTLVQCKQWKSGWSIPVEKVRELYGVMHAEGAQAATFVATTSFTAEAVAFAKGKPIELIDGTKLLTLVKGVQVSGKMSVPELSTEQHLTPVCPRCGEEMVIRTAERGANVGSQFWGCSTFPRCWGRREIR